MMKISLLATVQLYVINLRLSFFMLEDIASLATKMVETKKHIVLPLVYKLIELG